MRNDIIKIVRGNFFRIAQPLSKITWETSTKTVEDYVPQEGDKIEVNLLNRTKPPYSILNVAIDGNLLTYECNGNLDCGLYGVEIRIKQSDGQRYRSFQPDRIAIVFTNEEAGINVTDELDITTYNIDPALLLYVKGEKGDPGQDGTVTFEDLKPAQRESLKGDKGDTGTGIASIEQTTTSSESEGTNVVTVTMDDTNHTEYSFQVKNGAQGEKGDDGKSAYDVAVEQGYEGDEESWLASLKGGKGDDGDAGKSAYQVYLDNVPSGGTPMTEEEWLASLKGEQGEQGERGETVILGDGQEYTLYPTTGNNADGAMTQNAVTQNVRGLNGNNFPNPTSYNSFYFDNSGRIQTSNAYSCMIPVSQFRGKHLTMIGGKSTQYIFIINYTSTSANFCSGTGRVTGELNNTVVPNDANFLCLYLGNSTSGIELPVIYVEEFADTLNGLSKRIDDNYEIIVGYNFPNPTSYTNLWYDNNGNIVSGTLYSSIISVKDFRGKHLTMVGGVSSTYMFLQSYNNSKCVFCSGTGRVVGILNNTVVPDDANYLCMFLSGYVDSIVYPVIKVEDMPTTLFELDKKTAGETKMPVRFTGESSIGLAEPIVLANEGDSIEVDVSVGSDNLLSNGYGFANSAHSSGIGIGFSYICAAVRADDGTFVLPIATAMPLKKRYIFKMVYGANNITFYIDGVVVYTYSGSKTLTISSFGNAGTYGGWVGKINSMKVNGNDYVIYNNQVSNIGSDYICPKHLCEKKSDELDVYVQVSDEIYVGYHLKHSTKAYTANQYPSFYDVWGIVEPALYFYTGDGMHKMFTVFNPGEAELAVESIKGGTTSTYEYVCGIIHGFENIKVSGSVRQVSFLVDNKVVGETDVFSLRSCNVIDVVQFSELCQSRTNSNPFADVVKKWHIEDGKLQITSKVEFTRDAQTRKMQQAMFCVLRKIDGGTSGTFYLSNKDVKDDVPYIIYDTSDGWESVSDNNDLKSPDNDCRKITTCGASDLGFSIAVVKDNGEADGGMFVATNGNPYNKIYFQSHTTAETIATGKVYEATQEWEILM